MRVVTAQLPFHLFVGEPAVADEFSRLVKDIGGGNAFSLFVDAVFRDEEKRLRLDIVFVEKMHIFDGVVIGNEFSHLLHFALQFLVEISVLLVAYLFGPSDGGAHGQIADCERISGKDLHEVVILPENERFLDLFLRGFENFRHGEDIEIGIGVLAKIQSVEIDFHGESVRVGHILGEKLIFHRRIGVLVEFFGKRTK